MNDQNFDEELMNALLQTFQEEAGEHLDILNQALLKLERLPAGNEQNELIQQAFRSAHSLKGAARTVQQDAIQTISHHMEDILKSVRDDHAELTPDICDVLYDSLDGIQMLLNKQELDIQPLISALEAISQNLPDGKSGQTQLEDIDKPVAKKPKIETPKAEPIANEPVPEATAPVAETKTNDPVDKHETQENRRPVDSDESIRVALSKLDSLMAEVGELMVSQRSNEHHAHLIRTLRKRNDNLERQWQSIRNRLQRLNKHDDTIQSIIDALSSYHSQVEQVGNDITELDSVFHRDVLRLNMVTNRLQEDMRRVRMIPFGTQEAFLQRIVRDAARQENKVVNLKIEGLDAELDKKVLELLKDPLMHLLRNAVGHGIETQDERIESGKSAEGSICVSVQQRGSEAHIVVQDDGRGFQLEALRKNMSEERQISDDEVISHAFSPGVSTAVTVTSISGRGVGLDVVRQQIESLQGRIRVETTTSHGTTIQLIVPVSLAMTRVLLVKAGASQYALPLASVEKIVRLENTMRIEGRQMIRYKEKTLILASLPETLMTGELESEQPLAVIVASADQYIALLVDDVITEQEMAVKPFSYPLVAVKNLTGAALLGNGDPVVVLNIADIVKSARNVKPIRVNTLDEVDNPDMPTVMENILVVDDSITTRTLEKNILQAAGYQVTTATDGLEAINELKQNPIDLVVADVEMPNMDGITLTKQIRTDDTYKHLPVILVTSLESKEDRERGMLAGANAYIVKRGFSQSELLQTIKQLL